MLRKKLRSPTKMFNGHYEFKIYTFEHTIRV